MSETRPQPILHTSSSVASRPPKRRLTSPIDLNFFTPAATSFRPKPYTPHAASATSLDSQPKHPSQRTQTRSLELPSAGMDPLPSDPDVLFIHPPFTSFPGSHSHPEGLAYPLMAENPDWFLDADDFIAQGNTNPSAIAYPPQLEPPRGWCPAKKKDLRERGSEGWPEGEEPRLRCTFCRRTYAGVNAKSMWRRHVFEKHKIAMSNRRDGNDRPRGRGANKENRQSTVKVRDEAHDHIVSMEVAPQTDHHTFSHKSRFRSVATSEVKRRPEKLKRKDSVESPSTPRMTRSHSSLPEDDEEETPAQISADSNITQSSPPLTPPPSSFADTVNLSFENTEAFFNANTSPLQAKALIPPSPYDPLLTPSFRHSSPRHPFEQPWRFPSPSHPLHSQARDLSLSMLIRDGNSPASRLPGSSSILESPRYPLASPASRVFGKGELDFRTPERPASWRSPLGMFSSKGRLPMSVGDRLRFDSRRRIEESPLSRSSRSASSTHARLLSDEWTTTSLNLTAELLSNNDPFITIDREWNSLGTVSVERLDKTSPLSSPEGDSPVLRSGSLPSTIGLGLGLLEPFTLPDTDSPLATTESDFDGMLMYPPLSEDGRDRSEPTPPRRNAHSVPREATPPKKKRRMTIDN